MHTRALQHAPQTAPTACSFTGSAGTAVVTTDQALLWTDGRYFLQAESELPPGWTLMRAGTGHCPEVGGPGACLFRACSEPKKLPTTSRHAHACAPATLKPGHKIPDWLAEVLPAGARVGIDPFCHTVDAVRALSGKLQASCRGA
jgi:Xaa-Pro aminopeptidase